MTEPPPTHEQNLRLAAIGIAATCRRVDYPLPDLARVADRIAAYIETGVMPPPEPGEVD